LVDGENAVVTIDSLFSGYHGKKTGNDEEAESDGVTQ